MPDVRLNLSTVLVIVAMASAAAFAAGRSTSPPPAAVTPEPASPPAPPVAMPESDESLPPGHPPTGGGSLPPGHPALADSAGAAMGEPPPEAGLEWKAPPRWKQAPNPSSMRIATYRVPHAPGDAEDPELSVSQAGGGISANADRWVGQFDSAAQKSAKRSTRRVGTLEVTIVEVSGTYSGGMTADAATGETALLGAIVATPGMPHFFKLTGPVKSVRAARAEFDQLIGSLVTRGTSRAPE